MIPRMAQLGQRRHAIALGGIIVLLMISSVAILGMVHISRRSPALPTFEVQQGEFLDAVQFRGEVKALKSVTLSAPAEAGDLQILKLVTNGMAVKRGDPGAKLPELRTRRVRSVARAAADVPDQATTARSDVSPDVLVPEAPFLGTEVIRGIPLAEYAAYLEGFEDAGLTVGGGAEEGR